MTEELNPIRETIHAILDWFPEKITQFLKWLHPLKVVPVEKDCWWTIGEYQHEPAVQLIVKLMVTNRSESQISLIDFVPIDRKIKRNIFSVIHRLIGNHAVDPIIPPNTTEEIKIMSVFKPVISNKSTDLELKTILKNSFGKSNRTNIRFKSVHKK